MLQRDMILSEQGLDNSSSVQFLEMGVLLPRADKHDRLATFVAHG
jgi:hypothetical protein